MILSLIAKTKHFVEIGLYAGQGFISNTRDEESRVLGLHLIENAHLVHLGSITRCRTLMPVFRTEIAHKEPIFLLTGLRMLIEFVQHVMKE
jgi:hypothetical protein